MCIASQTRDDTSHIYYTHNIVFTLFVWAIYIFIFLLPIEIDCYTRPQCDNNSNNNQIFPNRSCLSKGSIFFSLFEFFVYTVFGLLLYF